MQKETKNNTESAEQAKASAPQTPPKVPAKDPMPEAVIATPGAPTDEEEASSLKGLVIGLLAVILVLILGGLYLWGANLGSDVPQATEQPVNNEPETVRANADVEALKTVSSSDEIDAIEADLDSTLLDTLDAELGQIEAELQ